MREVIICIVKASPKPKASDACFLNAANYLARGGRGLFYYKFERFFDEKVGESWTQG